MRNSIGLLLLGMVIGTSNLATSASATPVHPIPAYQSDEIQLAQYGVTPREQYYLNRRQYYLNRRNYYMQRRAYYNQRRQYYYGRRDYYNNRYNYYNNRPY